MEMDSPRFVIDVLSRWLHVIFAVVLLGGGLFMRFVLHPAVMQEPADRVASLRERVVGVWKKFVMLSIALLLLSGFYNYLVVALPNHKGDGLYHALMGTKIILALVVFFLASALTGRSPALQKLRDNAGRWMTVTVTLGILIVMIAGFLKIRGTPEATTDTEPDENPAATAQP
jgi:uncharacterized membrane protein